MSPIIPYAGWNTRKQKRRDIYKRYYFICEGANTEKWYFEKLIDIRKSLAIHANLEIIFLEKTGAHKHLSTPKQLIEFAIKQKKCKKVTFNKAIDKMIVVFDADIFEVKDPSLYSEILTLKSDDTIFGVTNPSFELFLLLHKENSFEDIILPKAKEIMQNDWVGKSKHNRRRYVEQVFRDTFNMRPKENKEVENLAEHVKIAIEQEKKLNNNISNCRGSLTSNIGCILEKIIDDKCTD